jgi:hypothetical protein
MIIELYQQPVLSFVYKIPEKAGGIPFVRLKKELVLKQTPIYKELYALQDGV